MSQISTIVAVVIVVIMRKKDAASRLYGRVDIGITYTLFIGGILLEVCAMFTVLLASPWTWWWLEDRGYHRLARMSWSLVRRPETARALWSGRMGQYSYLSYIGLYEDEPATLSQQVMSMVRKTAGAIDIRDKEKRLFWVSKLLDTGYTAVDDTIMEHVLDEIHSCPREDDDGQGARRQWHHMGHHFGPSLPGAIQLHVVLVAVHPDAASILQIGFGSNPQSALKVLAGLFMPSMDDLSSIGSSKDDSLLCAIRDKVRDEASTFPWLTEDRDEVLKELRDIWVRLLIYAASKSRPEAHVAQLLTFVWLLMAHCSLGDCTPCRVESIRPPQDSAYMKPPATLRGVDSVLVTSRPANQRADNLTTGGSSANDHGSSGLGTSVQQSPRRRGSSYETQELRVWHHWAA
uniref:DUF4220 domain-containing protein n=1 Tax=Oryza punctata TaxID=4537 RepID=A0A0E0LSI7_ORYPU